MGGRAMLRRVLSMPPTVPYTARDMRMRCRCEPPGWEMLLPRVAGRAEFLRAWVS